MIGELHHELELHVPASEAWDLFGTLRIGQLIAEELPQLFQSVELTEGDGGVGTVLKLTFAPGHSFKSFFIPILNLNLNLNSNSCLCNSEYLCLKIQEHVTDLL